jgi:hypothetical protein
MKLEDLRRDNLGKTVAYFPKDGANSKLVAVTYPDYCIKAFYMTCESLEQLEMSKTMLNPGNKSLLAVGMWFISVEAFVNTLLRIACRFRNDSFDELKKRDIGSRLSSLLEVLGVNKKSFYTSGIFQRFAEFKAFRNEMFHDRTGETELVFNKTKFSSVPHQANQVDAVQAAIISLEIFHAFRYVYARLDLMPDIFVQKDDSFGYVKFDLLYNQLLKPFFYGVLVKHKLTSDLMLDPTLMELDVSGIAAAGEVGILIKAVQDDKFKFLPNEQDTSIGSALLADIRTSIAQNTAEHFSLGNYVRKNG